jgi:low temperature requirement protein LtrA
MSTSSDPVTEGSDRPGPQPLVRPPRLHLGREGSASKLELFFDVAYVLVVMELAEAFYKNLSWTGLAVMVGLFVAIWVSWVGFTLYANRFDTDDVVFRIGKLAATASIAGCAASASDAIGKLAVPFAACYLANRIILFLLYLRAWRHIEEGRPTILVYLVTVAASAALFGVSLAVPGTARYVLWGVAVLVSAAGPALATLRSDQLPLHIEHLPERFGLLVILVLGEAVGGASRGLHDAGWKTGSVITGLLGFVVAAGMWWMYFDVTATSSQEQLDEAEEEVEEESGPGEGETESVATDERHDLFVYGHLPVALGVVLAGVGLEELVVHPDDPAPSAAGWLLAAGLAIFLAGVAVVIGGTSHTVRTIWPWPVAAIPLVLLGALVPFPSALLLVAAYTLGVLGLAVQGTLASRSPETELSGAD